MSYLNTFEFATRQDLVETLFASPLAHPALRLGGTRYQGDGKIPSTYMKDTSLHCFTHEAGHMLDFFLRGKTERLARPAFGLHYPEQWVVDRFCAEPTTTRAVHTEARATAIQLHLLEILGWDIDANAFLVDMARTLGGSSVQLEDAYCIPRRRAETRRLDAENKRTWNRREIMQEQADRDTLKAFMQASSALNSASCAAYRQDRVEYVLKHCVKYHSRLSPEHLLTTWHEMLAWMDENLTDETRRDLIAA